MYGDDAVESVTVRKVSAYSAGALAATVRKVASADDGVPVSSGVTESTTSTVGSKFDPKAGVTASDDIDGDLTDKITIEGSVDVNKVGDYKLVYSVTNSRGKTTTFTRTVHVQKRAVVPAADKGTKGAATASGAAGTAATGASVLVIALLALAAAAACVIFRLRGKEERLCTP